MRALVQRVERAQVTSSGRLLGSTARGLLVLVGVTHDDEVETARKLASKVVKLRIFSDDAGKMNRSLTDVGGSVLAISQFTLYADSRNGNRPSYTDAARPEVAEPLFDEFVRAMRELGPSVETGEFGADMQVELVNDGPVTLWLDSDIL